MFPSIRSKFTLCFFGIFLFVSGCVSLKPVTLDQKTQLENQILGSFERLNDSLLLLSSVRDTQPIPERKLSPYERETLQAMMNREFIRDEIDQFKDEQFVGEGKDGLLILLNQPEDEIRNNKLKRLVEEENRNRQVIFERIIQMGDKLTAADRSLVQLIFYRLQRQVAKPGWKVQLEDGGWHEVEIENTTSDKAP